MELLQGEGWVSSDAFLDLVHRHWSLDDLVVVEELLTFVSPAMHVLRPYLPSCPPASGSTGSDLRSTRI